jgi:hypothetical protein
MKDYTWRVMLRAGRAIRHLFPHGTIQSGHEPGCAWVHFPTSAARSPYHNPPQIQGIISQP